MGSVRLVTEVPGPKSRAVFERAQAHTPKSVGHITPVAIARAKGALLTDVDGNTFIDFAGGIGTMNVGHCADEVVGAIREQAERYLHLCFMVNTYEPYVDLAEKLNAITPGNFPKKTAFFNSGAEAVENAVKVARAYTRRPAVISFDHSFHGRTLLTLALTGHVRPYKAGFGPFPPEIYHLPFPYHYRCPSGPEYPCCPAHSPDYILEVFETQVPPESVAAVIAEPVLGEGGFVVPPPDYFRRLKRICEEHGILFIADEVQSGFARTGRMFAIEHFGVEPDIIVSAKSMAGGMPLSAVTARAEIMDAPQVGGLGGTYGGNPVACQAALAAISVIERQGLVERARAIGQRVMDRFRQMQNRYPLVGDVRGLGAMCALELVRDRRTREPAVQETAQVIRHCYEHGLIVLRAGMGNVVRTLMPLVITEEQLEEGLDILEGAVRAVSGAGRD